MIVDYLKRSHDLQAENHWLMASHLIVRGQSLQNNKSGGDLKWTSTMPWDWAG